MFTTKKEIPIPAKSMLEEVGLRTGSENEESLSNFPGYGEFIRKRFENINFNGNIREMLSMQDDFSLDKMCPQKGKYSSGLYSDSTRPSEYNPAEGKPPKYLRRIEEIDSDYFFQYLNNMMYAINYNATSSIREYNSKHKVSSMIYDDESGEYTSASELLVEYQGDYSPEELARAKEKIPYLLRRLHDKSKAINVHIISLIKAYEISKAYVNNKNKSVAKSRRVSVKPSDLLGFDIYYMNPDGSLGYVFPPNANNGDRFFKAGRDWIFGREKDSYYNDMISLLHYYDVMGIDIKEEDPTIYDEKYIMSLTVTYITSNREYVTRNGRRGYHREAFEALRNMPLENFQSAASVSEIDAYDVIDNTIHIWNDSVFIPNYMKYRLEECSIEERQEINNTLLRFLTMYNIVYREDIDVNHLITQDGFFFKNGDEPLLIDISMMYDNMETIPVDSKALINENGYFVLLSSEHTSHCLDVLKNSSYLFDYLLKLSKSIRPLACRDWEEIRV